MGRTSIWRLTIRKQARVGSFDIRRQSNPSFYLRKVANCYHPEYDDDTTIIPRSTPIIARRLPPSKPGRGTAQRYVSGKMPMNALPNAGRREKNFGNAPTAVKKAEPATSNGGSNFPGLSSGGGTGDSEEDKIAAMFQASSEQWNKTQEQMAKCVYSFEYDEIFIVSLFLFFDY